MDWEYNAEEQSLLIKLVLWSFNKPTKKHSLFKLTDTFWREE